MTPPILKELFDTWRKENRSFCVNHLNYDKTDAFFNAENGQVKLSKGGGEFSYPNGYLIECKEAWEERHLYEGESPAFIPKQFVEDIALHLLKHTKPKVIYLQVTSRCNYACPMCPYHGEGYEGKFFKDNPELKAKDMPLDEAKRYVDKIVEYGVEMISMTPQGEFFLYPHWEEISRYIKSKGIKVSTTTNGSLVTPDVIKKLSDIGFDEMIFSIDGIKKDVYAKVRSANDDHYHTAINAPILAAQAGIYSIVHFVQQTLNQGEKEELFSFYKKGGVNALSFTHERQVSENGYTFVSDVKTYNYVHGLCNAYDYCVLVDGNLTHCCGIGGRYATIKPVLDQYSLRDHSLEDTVKYNHSLLIDRHNVMMKICLSCDLYQATLCVEREISIEEKYLKILQSSEEHHYKIPEKISSLSDEILLFLYQNQIVADMKKAKIL